MSNKYENECVIMNPSGGTSIHCPAFPEDCSYVRVCDALGNEIAYWVVDEWAESTEQAMEVMGAILGAFNGSQQNQTLGRNNQKTYT